MSPTIEKQYSKKKELSLESITMQVMIKQAGFIRFCSEGGVLWRSGLPYSSFSWKSDAGDTFTSYGKKEDGEISAYISAGDTLILW